MPALRRAPPAAAAGAPRNGDGAGGAGERPVVRPEWDRQRRKGQRKEVAVMPWSGNNVSDFEVLLSKVRTKLEVVLVQETCMLQ